MLKTLGSGITSKMVKVRAGLDSLENKYAVPALSAVNDSLSAGQSIVSVLHILRNMF